MCETSWHKEVLSICEAFYFSVTEISSGAKSLLVTSTEDTRDASYSRQNE